MSVELRLRKDLMQKIIRSHRVFVENSENTSLRYFHFEIDKNILKISTTDGTRLLQSTISTENSIKENITFDIDAEQIQKLVIYRSISLYIYLTVNNDTVMFADKGNGTIQTYKLMKFKYPDVERIINDYNYQDKKHSIILNKNFFKDLDVLFNNDRRATNIELNVHIKDSCKPIIAKAKADNIQQIAILMPVQDKE